MIIIPVHDMVLFPKVNFYFKKDTYRQWSGAEAEAGAEILFLLQRGEKEIKDCTAEDFYPVGLLAEVAGIDLRQRISQRKRRTEFLNGSVRPCFSSCRATSGAYGSEISCSAGARRKR